MSEILIIYNKIKGDHVISCPNQVEGKVNLKICQECPQNRGFIESKSNKWVRCQPL